MHTILMTSLISSFNIFNYLHPHPLYLNSNIFVPFFRVGSDELVHQLLALVVLEVDHLDSSGSQVIIPAYKGVVLTHDNTLDSKHDTSSGAHITGRQCGVHGSVLVNLSSESTSVLKSVNFTVVYGGAVLDSSVVSLSEHSTVSSNQNSTNGNTSLVFTCVRSADQRSKIMGKGQIRTVTT